MHPQHRRTVRPQLFALAAIAVLSIAPRLKAQDVQPVPPGPPRIVIEAIDFDFGAVGLGTPLEHEFTFTNGGQSPLEIIRIEPTYGCAVVGEPPSLVEPGARASLKLSLNPDYLRGRFEKQVVVNTSDPIRSSIVLTLRGDLRRLIDVTPPAAGFGRLDPKEYIERTILITNNSDKPFRLTMNDPPAEGPFDFHLVESIRGWEYKLFVGTRPPFRAGTIRSEITLHSDVESQKTITIPAYAIISDRLEVTPTSIPVRLQNVEPRKAESAIAHTIQFSNFGDAPVRLVGASCTDSSVMTSVHEVVAGRRYRVVVELPGNYRMPDDGASVLLMTDDEQMPTIDVPIGSTRRLALPAPRPATASNTNTPRKTNPVLQMIGKAAPPIKLTTVDGAPISNVEIGYHPATVLDFFAANCGFCKKQIPKVEELRVLYESRGVRFVNVCETMKIPFKPDEVRGVLGELGANLEFAMDPGNQVGRAYSVTGYPALFIIRPDGVIEHVISGNKSNLVSDASEKLDKLLQAEADKVGARAEAKSTGR